MENDVIQSLIADDNTKNDCTDMENETELDKDNGIVILNATAKWTDDQNSNTLEKINLTVIPGRLLAVIGPVGAGKVNIVQIVNTIYLRGSFTVVTTGNYKKQIKIQIN